MSKSNLILFKEKFNLSDSFINIIESMFGKLTEYGYISSMNKNKFYARLFDNINEVIIGAKNKYDYKSGFYDANKKVLYIKDENDIPAVYLRLIYVITSHEIDKDEYVTGYSTTKLRKDNYKLDYVNFGFNRAVVSNLVAKICNILPADLKILPSYKTYHHNFLGYNIETTNELYALEGKVLSEFCYAVDLDEELFYSGLFLHNPRKYFENILTKKRFDDKAKTEFVKLFDTLSRNYSTYNKLIFLSKKLNENYIEIRKNALKKSNEKDIKDKTAIEEYIRSIILRISSDSSTVEEEDYEFDLTQNLTETVENLENAIMSDLIKVQDMLVDRVIISAKGLTSYLLASKLKRFSDILVVPNDKILEAIKNTIIFKLMPENEITSVNIIQKIKYMIIQKILSEERFAEVSKTFGFYNINTLINEEAGTSIIILNSDKRFAKLLLVKGLNKKIGDTSIEAPEYIPLDNLKHIMHTDYSNMYIGSIEKLFTDLQNYLPELSNISIDNVYIFDYENEKYLLVYTKEGVISLKVKSKSNKYEFTKLNLSEYFAVFGQDKINKLTQNSSLPVIYKK